MSTKTFATASNARRAARAAGFELDQVEIVQDGAKFSFAAKTESPATVSPAQVLLAHEDGDFGLCLATEANAMAERLAADEGLTITVRDPISDAVLFTATPPAPRAPAQTEDPDMAKKTAPKAPKAPVAQVPVYAVTFSFERTDDAAAMKAAIVFARKVGFEATLTLPSGETLPVPTKAAKPGLTPKAPKEPKAPRVAKDAPSGKTAAVLALCSRSTGATPAELIKATGWTGAPWKYNLAKWAGRYGYDFATNKVGEGKAVETRYVLTKKPAEVSAAT